MRLIPKGSGARPIVNLSKKTVSIIKLDIS